MSATKGDRLSWSSQDCPGFGNKISLSWECPQPGNQNIGQPEASVRNQANWFTFINSLNLEYDSILLMMRLSLRVVGDLPGIYTD